jgi:hypothetical protein
VCLPLVMWQPRDPLRSSPRHHLQVCVRVKTLTLLSVSPSSLWRPQDPLRSSPRHHLQICLRVKTLSLLSDSIQPDHHPGCDALGKFVGELNGGVAEMTEICALGGGVARVTQIVEHWGKFVGEFHGWGVKGDPHCSALGRFRWQI